MDGTPSSPHTAAIRNLSVKPGIIKKQNSLVHSYTFLQVLYKPGSPYMQIMLLAAKTRQGGLIFGPRFFESVVLL